MTLTLQCACCTQFLLDYIAAGNQLVEIQMRPQKTSSDRRTRASRPLTLAKTAAGVARKQLADHQRRIPCHCSNKLRTHHAAPPSG